MRHTPATAPDLLLEESFHRPSESNRQAMPRRGHIVAGPGRRHKGAHRVIVIAAIILLALALVAAIWF